MTKQWFTYPASSEALKNSMLAICASVLLLLFFCILSSGDLHAGFGLIQNWLQPGGSLFWSSLTSLGDARTLLCFAMLLSIRTPKFWMRFLLAAAGTALAVKAIRLGFPTHRPLEILGRSNMTVIGIERTGSSLPSSHAALGWAFVSLFVLEYGCLKSLPVLLVAILLALSRIAVGAHWPIDVVTGAFVGLSAGYLTWKFGNGCLEAVGKPATLGLMLICALAILSLPFDAQGYPESLLIRCLATLIGVWAMLRRRLIETGKPHSPLESAPSSSA